MAAFNLQGQIVDLHMSSPEDWGFPTERVIGRNLNDILPPEVARRLGPLQAEVLSTGRMRQGEYVIEHPRLGSRHREFRADAGAAQLLGRKQPMINALARLGGMVPGELPKSVAALGIAGGVGALFATHPPIEERIATLRAMESLGPASA
jgi:hypothetical protein